MLNILVQLVLIRCDLFWSVKNLRSFSRLSFSDNRFKSGVALTMAR